MKRTFACLLTAAALVLTACSQTPSDSSAASSAEATPAPTEAPAATAAPTEEPATAEAAPADTGDLYAGYVQDFEEVGTMVRPVDTDDGRALNLECTLDTEIDQLIYDHYRFELQGDLEASLDQVGSLENYRTTVENDVKNVQSGAGMQSYTLHSLGVLTKEQVEGAAPADLAVLTQDVTDCGLVQWTVASVDLSWTYTEAEKAKGPQLDEGRYQRYFLVGKTAEDDSWKLCDFFWDTFLPQS